MNGKKKIIGENIHMMEMQNCYKFQLLKKLSSIQ